MSLFVWSENLSVNIKTIDEQHKKLVNIINELFDSMKVGKGKEVIGNVLNEMIEYTVAHFKTEEELFRKHIYPQSYSHKKEHDELTKQASDLKKAFDKGEPVITVEVMNFLKDWLNSHILGSDKKYGPYLISKGVS